MVSISYDKLGWIIYFAFVVFIVFGVVFVMGFIGSLFITREFFNSKKKQNKNDLKTW